MGEKKRVMIANNIYINDHVNKEKKSLSNSKKIIFNF
jgi:hypothetical protein